MKLIIEDTLLLDGSIEESINESTGNTERNYYISGIFSTPEKKNRNGRVYSRAIWEREITKYQKEINEKTVNTLGEWQHPPRSTVDPLKAVMRIIELKLDETGNVVGKAKILNDNTEQTNKLKGLIKEGIKIGVSSRGIGKVSATGIVEDFKLITYDAVDMPSDYNAMLNGVVEGYHFENGMLMEKEFQIDENGCVGEACHLIPQNEEENTLCLIQEKINEAIEVTKKEIFEGIEEYMTDAFEQITEAYSTSEESLVKEIECHVNKKTLSLISDISDYLDNTGVIQEKTKIKDTIDTEAAKILINALRQTKAK